MVGMGFRRIALAQGFLDAHSAQAFVAGDTPPPWGEDMKRDTAMRPPGPPPAAATGARTPWHE